MLIRWLLQSPTPEFSRAVAAAKQSLGLDGPYIATQVQYCVLSAVCCGWCSPPAATRPGATVGEVF